jgi:hypothetical protein
MGLMTYPEARVEAEAALSGGDARAAFAALRPVLEYPGRIDEPDWRGALRLFARIAAELAGDEWARHVRLAAEDPDDPQALFDLGYHLIEQSLPAAAATVLARANRLAPGDATLLSEFVAALEGAGLNREAVRILRGSGDVLRDSPACQYLLGFNAMMTADLQTPRKVLRQIAAVPDEDVQAMARTLRDMLARADAIRGVTPLDERDLRGWHFVVTGGMLLHLSPYGFDEGMNGRYAYTSDSAERCLEGIRRLEAVLATWSVRPPRVYYAPGRDSATLGTAAATVLGLPAEPWPVEGAEEPGLIVAYDVGRLPPETWEGLARCRAGQVIWSHASCWTEEPPFAADLTTLLYQTNFSPWQAGRLRFDPQAERAVPAPEDPRAAEELAAEIVATEMEPDALADLPQLAALATAAARVGGDAAPGPFRITGHRGRQRTDSPVKSSRFL